MVNELVDYRASLKQMADDLWSSQIVVHSIVAFLAQRLHNMFGLTITMCADIDALQVGNALQQFL